MPPKPSPALRDVKSDLEKLRARQAEDEEREDETEEAALALLVETMRPFAEARAAEAVTPEDTAITSRLVARAWMMAQAHQTHAASRRLSLARAHAGQRVALRNGATLESLPPQAVYVDHAAPPPAPETPATPPAPAPALDNRGDQP